jgi:hypothetical protein
MKSDGKYLSPRMLQAVGVLLLVAACMYWAVTGQQSALIISAAMGLIGLGSYAGINISVRQEIKEHQAEVEQKRGAPVPNLVRGRPPVYPGQDEPYEPGNQQLDEDVGDSKDTQ